MTSEEYAQILDDFELDKKIGLIPEDFDLTSYIEQRRREFESKANGGSVGIEVLFGPKVPAAPSQLVSESDILLGYRGDAAYRSKSEQSKSIGQGNVGTKSDFGDGPAQGGGGGGGDGPPSIINLPTKDKSTELFTFDEYTGKPMTYADVATANKFLNFVKTKGGYTMGENTEADALYDAYKTATGRDTFMQDATVDSVTNMRTTDIDGNTKSFMDRTSTITDNPTGKMMKSLVVETPTSFTQRTITPTGIMENDVPQKFGDPQSLLVDPPKNIIGSELKDGGRVGLFMGGPALEGQALSIYNSMKDYGATDQAIADRLSSMGLYGGSTTDAPTTAQPIGYQGRGDDNPYAGQVVDQTDYSFNKKNYGPGQKLEINPAAVGMSFYDSTTGTSTPNKVVKEDKGIIGKTIDSFMGAAIPEKQLSQFTSPTTGGTLTGPAELGFMTKNIEGIPGNLTREDLRGMYDNYNKFLGRPSNFANARVKGPAGELINLVPVVGSAARMFGSGGDKSLQSKYTVDGAGFGNTGMRDEFGLGTFDAKDGFLGLTGNTTRTYVDRMQDKLNDLEDFFGSRIDGFDINNLDPATLSKMKGINSFYTKQIQAYQQRLATEELNRQEKERERMEASAANRKEARDITSRLEQEFRDDSGGGFDVSGPDTSANPTGRSNRASQERGFALHGAKGGSVPTGLATMFTRRR